VSDPSILETYKLDPVFITSRVDKTKAYYNQQIIYTYTIFTRVSLKRLPKINFPDYEAFHREPLFYRKVYTTKIKGVPYKAIEFKCALFPFMTDDQVVEPFFVEVKKDCFPDYILNEQEIKNLFHSSSFYNIKSKPIKINIQSLPLNDKPLSFSGLVGKFEISSDIDKKDIILNDQVVLTVHVKGNGNLRSIPDIRMPIIDKLREYDSNIFLNYDKKEPMVSGEKLFRSVFVPRETGKDTIQSIGFSYFDEELGTYKTVWTDPIDINIYASEEEKNKEFEIEHKPGSKEKLISLFVKYKQYLKYAFIIIFLFVILFPLLKRKKE